MPLTPYLVPPVPFTQVYSPLFAAQNTCYPLTFNPHAAANFSDDIFIPSGTYTLDALLSDSGKAGFWERIKHALGHFYRKSLSLPVADAAFLGVGPLKTYIDTDDVKSLIPEGFHMYAEGNVPSLKDARVVYVQNVHSIQGSKIGSQAVLQGVVEEARRHGKKVLVRIEGKELDRNVDDFRTLLGVPCKGVDNVDVVRKMMLEEQRLEDQIIQGTLSEKDAVQKLGELWKRSIVDRNDAHVRCIQEDMKKYDRVVVWMGAGHTQGAALGKSLNVFLKGTLHVAYRPDCYNDKTILTADLARSRYHLLRMMSFMHKDIGKALGEIDLAIRFNNRSPDLWRNKALLVAGRSKEEALEHINHALKLYPDFNEAIEDKIEWMLGLLNELNTEAKSIKQTETLDVLKQRVSRLESGLKKIMPPSDVRSLLKRAEKLYETGVVPEGIRSLSLSAWRTKRQKIQEVLQTLKGKIAGSEEL